jgi:hypothetical protein
MYNPLLLYPAAVCIIVNCIFRETGLVEEHIVPYRTDRDKADLSTFKVMTLKKRKK